MYVNNRQWHWWIDSHNSFLIHQKKDFSGNQYILWGLFVLSIQQPKTDSRNINQFLCPSTWISTVKIIYYSDFWNVKAQNITNVFSQLRLLCQTKMMEKDINQVYIQAHYLERDVHFIWSPQFMFHFTLYWGSYNFLYRLADVVNSCVNQNTSFIKKKTMIKV